MKKHLLIVRLSSFGDVAMTVPVIDRLRRNYPDLKITILTTEFFSALFNQIPDINFTFFQTKHNSFLGLISLYWQIKKLKIDHMIDLHNVIRTKTLRFLLSLFGGLSGTYISLNKGRKEKAELINGKKLIRLKSMHQRYSDAFKELSLKIDLAKFVFYTRKEINYSKYRFNKNKKLIGIAPFSKHKCKEYSVSNILKIIRALNDSFEILIFGAPGKESQKIDRICNKVKNTYNVSSINSLDEQMSLISNLELMISMDSANGHVAALFGIDVVSIWGATHPYTGYRPFNQTDDNSITPDLNVFKRLPVTVYGYKCPDEFKDVINTIPVEKVLDQVYKSI